jgi:hypothetical protein
MLPYAIALRGRVINPVVGVYEDRTAVTLPSLKNIVSIRMRR